MSYFGRVAQRKKMSKTLDFFLYEDIAVFFLIIIFRELSALYTLYLLTTTRSTKVKISWPTCQKISFSSLLFLTRDLFAEKRRKNTQVG